MLHVRTKDSALKKVCSSMGHKTKGMGGGWWRGGGRGWSSVGWEDGGEMGVQNDWFTLV